MIRYTIRSSTLPKPLLIVIFRIHFSIYRRRINRSNTSQLFNRHHSPRYLLRCCSFSLRSINRGSLCHYSRICSLVPFNFRLNNKPQMTKNPIFHHIPRSQYNILSSAFLRVKWNTSTILRLP